jgi:beta-carotene 3-hydroxylase
MEIVTWLTHKFVMHGFLWYLHADHHQPKYKSIFERNDLFFVIFAIPSIILLYSGIDPQLNFKFFIGLGILFYGMSYFFVHEIIIHQRIKWFSKTNIAYFKGLRRAHKVHHKRLGKEQGECFGMLYVPKKYFF